MLVNTRRDRGRNRVKYTKKERIIQLLLSRRPAEEGGEAYTYADIARMVGAADAYVRGVAARTLEDRDLIARRKSMPLRGKSVKVMKIMLEHPGWPVARVAKEAGVAVSLAWRVEAKYFKVVKVRVRKEEGKQEGDRDEDN